MPINKFLYFSDFFAIPVMMLVFAWLAFRSASFAAVAPDFFISGVIGALAWTLAEYLIHRYAYHHAPLLSPLHDAHHKKPNEFIGAPSFVSIPILVAVGFLPIYPFDPVAACGFVAGLSLGYEGYMFVHHATHHFKIEPGDWLYPARVRHMAHHYADATNFGVVTGFWDHVFRTVRVPRRDRASRNAVPR